MRSLLVSSVVLLSATSSLAGDQPPELLRLLVALHEELQVHRLDERQASEVRAALQQAIAIVRRPVTGSCPGCGAPVTPALVDVCSATFSGQAKQDCIAAVYAARFDVTEVLVACERTFEGDANELACLRSAVRAPVPLTAAIEACERAFEGDANELLCVDALASARCDVAGLIDACETAMDGDPNELACLATVALAPRDPVGLVRLCDDLTSGDAEELACMRRMVSASSPR